MGWFACGVLCVTGRVIQQEFQGLLEVTIALIPVLPSALFLCCYCSFLQLASCVIIS